MTAPWQPVREPLRATLTRTVALALIVGTVLAIVRRLGVAGWMIAVVLVLWPSFGGHWVDLWFLNWLRPRISPARATQASARVAVWFGGGCLLAFGMCLTASALTTFPRSRWPAWWMGGVGFIVVELIAQSALQLRGRPSFYNGRA